MQTCDAGRDGKGARRRGGSAVRMALVCLLGALAGGEARGFEHRKSTPSFGAQFGYGRLLAGESLVVDRWPLGGERFELDREFDISETHTRWGASGHFSIRFVIDQNEALGFGFDDLRYRRKGGYTDGQVDLIPRWVKFTTFHADYFLYFRRRERISSYVAPLVGIQQREYRFKGSEVSTQEYKLLYGAQIGVEYFVRRSFSFDLSGHAYGLRSGSGTNLVVQPAIGIHIYVI